MDMLRTQDQMTSLTKGVIKCVTVWLNLDRFTYNEGVELDNL